MKDIAYVGIDPGTKGAYCLLVPSTKQIAFKPTTDPPMTTLAWFNLIQNQLDLRVVMVEKVHSIQGSSAKSNFNFGRNVERVNIIPMCTGASVDLVTPKKWQKFVGVTAKSKAIKKDVANICERIYPHAKLYGPRGGLLDGRSDALMIAHYAYLNYNQEKI